MLGSWLGRFRLALRSWARRSDSERKPARAPSVRSLDRTRRVDEHHEGGAHAFGELLGDAGRLARHELGSHTHSSNLFCQPTSDRFAAPRMSSVSDRSSIQFVTNTRSRAANTPSLNLFGNASINRSCPIAKPDAISRRTTKLFDEILVRPAAAERVLTPQLRRVGDDLEDRVGVVVETAHQMGADLELDAESRGAFPAPAESDRGCPRSSNPRAWVRPSGSPARRDSWCRGCAAGWCSGAAGCPPTAVSRCGSRYVDEPLPESGARLGVADGVEAALSGSRSPSSAKNVSSIARTSTSASGVGLPNHSAPI